MGVTAVLIECLKGLAGALWVRAVVGLEDWRHRASEVRLRPSEAPLLAFLMDSREEKEAK